MIAIWEASNRICGKRRRPWAPPGPPMLWPLVIREGSGAKAGGGGITVLLPRCAARMRAGAFSAPGVESGQWRALTELARGLAAARRGHVDHQQSARAPAPRRASDVTQQTAIRDGAVTSADLSGRKWPFRLKKTGKVTF